MPHPPLDAEQIRALFTKPYGTPGPTAAQWKAVYANFTHQNVTWLNVGTDINDTSFVQVAKRFFSYVWNITCDFLWAQFRITRGHFEFFDVNGCEYVILCDAFGN